MTKSSRSSQEKQLQANSPSERRRLVPLWQAVVLPLVAILIFFLLVEGGLALFGVKPALQTEDPFVGFAANVPLFIPAPGPDGGKVMVTAENKLDYFNAQSFPLKKDPGTYRIFCLGGSTTYGRPYNDRTSFSGWLRELLPAEDGHKHWEVINAGGISYASYRVAHLMEELVKYKPDLFIIYTGHNEFLEERTYHKLRQVPPAVRSTVALLARTRTWAVMSSALKSLGVYPQVEKKGRDLMGVKVNAILDQSAGLDRYNRDDKLRKDILMHYRVSLERMVELARSVGAKVIFVTPASNLKDCSPFKSQHTKGLDKAMQQRSEQLLARANEAIGRKDWNEALKDLDSALSSDPRYAELLYRRGKVLLALGRFDEAGNALRQARDEDICPLRALTPMRRIVTEVARDQGVPVVDFVGLLRRRMQAQYGYPIPGKEYFLDHVHPTIEGNKILALALLKTMADQGIVQPRPDWGKQDIAAVTERVESRVDQKAHGQALANLARVLLWAGKTEDAGRLARKALATAGEVQKVAVDSSSILVTVYQRMGHPERAVQALYSALEKAPGAIELHLKLALALLDPPYFQPAQAAAHLLLVCQQMPQWDAPQQYFGLAMARMGRPDIAYASLLDALRLNPGNTGAKATLNQVRAQLKGYSPSPEVPYISLAIYPSQAPLSLVQMRRDSNGRPVPDGIKVEFYENGRVKHYQEFGRGVPNGLELAWDSDGRLVSRVLYRDGTPVKTASK
jgi:tetratricopeptide (TPR) repeat protein